MTLISVGGWRQNDDKTWCDSEVAEAFHRTYSYWKLKSDSLNLVYS